MVEPILRNISDADILVADITRLNFNVVFEIGYAIGRSKRLFLIRNRALEGSDELVRQVGVFDTIGYETYSNSDELAALLEGVASTDPITFSTEVNRTAPVFAVLPKEKTDAEIRFVSRLKKARLEFRKFDPEEHGRLAGRDAIDHVAQSFGVASLLLPGIRRDGEVHNYRAAFTSGIAHGLEKATLLLQEGDDPVPIDYRDLVAAVRFPDQIDQHIARFAADVTALFQAGAPAAIREPRSFLEGLSLGASSAENELQELGHYYLETDEFRRALRGEARVVAGRKGSGKTALFVQVRNKIRRDKDMIVLDLKPEGFQLLKFKERVLDFLEEGARAHTVTAFWEYLLLLESCQKILVQDEKLHMRDNRLFEPYRNIADNYFKDGHVTEGDFAERMLLLTQRIADDFESRRSDEYDTSLSTGEITELLHVHDVAELRASVVEYLRNKDGLWILFDNLDKGWSAHGVTEDDVLALRCLIDAITNLERQLRRSGVAAHGLVFIRNDVLDLLISATSDRGKLSRVVLDWTDAELLREMLRRRLVYAGAEKGASFDQIWREIAVTHVNHQESSSYLIDRCLMRPRAFLDLVAACRSHAVNLGRERITEDDIIHGEEAFGTELVNNISFELQDVLPGAEDGLYQFLEAPVRMRVSEVRERLQPVMAGDNIDRLWYMFLWHGVFGAVRGSEDVAFIYDAKYDMRRLQGLLENRGGDTAMVAINPAFWRALEVTDSG